MSLTDSLLAFLEGIPPELIVIFISMIPFIELRGALPVAILVYEMPLYLAFPLAVIGNLIPVPFILLFLGDIEVRLRRFKVWNRFFDWLYARTKKRASDKIEMYEEIAIMLFVAIPLPMTGAWTGSLIAYLFGLDVKKSFAIVALGVVIAGIIVTSLIYFGLWGTKYV